MKIQILKLISDDFQKALRNLANSNLGSFKDNRDIAKLYGEVQAALMAYQKTRLAMAQKFGKENPAAPGEYNIQPENIQEMRAAYEKLLVEEVSFTIDRKITLPSNVLLCGMDQYQLSELLTDPEEAKAGSPTDSPATS